MDDLKFSFEKLIVWQKSRAFYKKLYEVTKLFPAEEKFGLVDQIRRAAISIASNIAEGSCRFSYKERERFLEIAYGSLMEVCCQIQLANDIQVLSDENFCLLKEDIREISLMLVSLKNNFASRK